MKFKLTLFALLLSSMHLFGQGKVCGTDSYTKSLEFSDPEYYKSMNEADAAWTQYKSQIDQSIVSRMEMLGDIDTSISIPIVYHVLYNTPVQNISDARLKAQIDKLNEDYNRFNADTVNTRNVFKSRTHQIKVNFFLANVDPQGNPTTGINRIYTDKTTWLQGNYMKLTETGGADAWPNSKYCNIWVCNLNDGGILAYATFPASFINILDGIVTGYKWVGGPNALPIDATMSGRTLTHEMGHWLGLPHIWGPGPLGPGDGTATAGSCLDDDGIDDTPFQNSQYWGCPTGNPNTCTEPTGPDFPDMFENYMDYVDDNCMNSFTKGQAERMYYTLSTYRPELGSTRAKLDFSDLGETVCQSFQGSSSLPVAWHTGNEDGKKDWQVDSTNGYVFFNNMAAPTTRSNDNLYCPGIAALLNSAGSLTHLDVSVSFKHAYAMRTGFPSDTLVVWASYDNGYSWEKLDMFTGTTLATAPTTSSLYTPGASDWVTHTYQLRYDVPNRAVAEAPILTTYQIRIENISSRGNAVYIDDFCTQSSIALVGINDNSSLVDMTISPNPTTGLLYLSSNAHAIKDCNIEIIDLQGRIVKNEFTITGKINIENLSSGVYFIKAQNSDFTSKYVKIVKQ